MSDIQSRRNALLHILDNLIRLPPRLMFHTAWLGSVILALGNIDPSTLSQPMQLWFMTLGGNALFELIKQISNGEKVSPTVIINTVEKALAESKIEEILSRDDLRDELLKLSDGIGTAIELATQQGYVNVSRILVAQTNLVIEEVRQSNATLLTEIRGLTQKVEALGGLSKAEHFRLGTIVTLSDEELLDQLKEGRLPVSVAKEIAEWVFVHKAWKVVTDDVKQRKVSIHFPAPKSSSGIYRTLAGMSAAIEDINDVILFLAVQQVEEIFLNYLKPLSEVGESDNYTAGTLAFNAISAIKEFSLNKAEASNEVKKYITLQAYFDFDVAEQLRAIIIRDSR